MPLPGDVSTLTLTGGPYTDATGAVVLSGVTGTLVPVDGNGRPTQVVHAADGSVIVPESVPITIASDGTWTVAGLAHTDDSHLTPTGFLYQVTWKVPAYRSTLVNKLISVPVASGATVDYDLTAQSTAAGVLVPVITGPQGPQGVQGPTGPTGPTGVTGESAYQIAVDHGFVGTQTQWLASLPLDVTSVTASQQYVADLTALRALNVTTAQPVQLVLGVGTYYYDTTATASEDNGTTVIAPTTGTGRWIRKDTPLPKALPGSIGWALSQAKTRTVRILVVGTSIAASDNSVLMTTVERLKQVYGDAGETDIMAGLGGGSYDLPYLGWKKQPYGGPGFTRARGDSTSSDWVSTVYGDTIDVEVSQESDGVAANVLIDGVSAGTVNCASGGTQKYAVRSTFSTTLGVHTVTVQKPASGFVYLERIRARRASAVGIAVINATLGGSSLNDMTNLRSATGNQVTGIAIGANVGLASVYDRDDVDINMTSFVVNDAGANTTNLNGFNTVYTPSLSYAIAHTLTRNVQLVQVVEMGGHFMLPAEVGTDNGRTFFAIRDALILAGRQNNHVLTVDWHGATILSDMNLYASRYYNAGTITGDLNAGGTYSGDFIHPNEQGSARGIGMLCAALGVDPPAYGKTSALRNSRLADLGGTLARTHKTFTVDGWTSREPIAAGMALQLPIGPSANGQPRIPYYVDHTVWEESGERANILAAATADAYGSYKVYTNAGIGALPNRKGVSGDWYTVTMLASGVVNITTSGRIRQDGVMLADGAPTALGFDPNPAVAGPIAYTFEWSPKDDTPTGKTIQILGGQLYDFSVVRAAGSPIISHHYRNLTFRNVGPEQRLDNDQAFVPDYLGQRYFEDLLGDGTVILPKKLVSYGETWDFTAQAPKAGRVGVYECMDRTTANYRLARQIGTSTQASSVYLGGGGETAASSLGTLTSAWKAGNGFPINVSGVASVVIRVTPAYTAGLSGICLAFQNGGTIYYLGPDGTWTTTLTAVRSASTYPVYAGENYVFTFSLPTGAVLTALGNTPDFRVVLAGMPAGAVQSSGTIVRGHSGCI